MSKLFKKLKKGLEDALAYSEGRLVLKSDLIEIPALSPKQERVAETGGQIDCFTLSPQTGDLIENKKSVQQVLIEANAKPAAGEI